jgi:hypothetical protein
MAHRRRRRKRTVEINFKKPVNLARAELLRQQCPVVPKEKNQNKGSKNGQPSELAAASPTTA